MQPKTMITPELTVAAIVEREARFLMVEEKVKGVTVLNQPAGHVEAGESPIDAVVRETREETAWGFTPVAITGVYMWQAFEQRPDIIRYVFCGECYDHDSMQTLDDGIITTHWLSYEELQGADDKLRSPMVLRAIDDYRAEQRYPLALLHIIPGEAANRE